MCFGDSIYMCLLENNPVDIFPTKRICSSNHHQGNKKIMKYIFTERENQNKS